MAEAQSWDELDLTPPGANDPDGLQRYLHENFARILQLAKQVQDITAELQTITSDLQTALAETNTDVSALTTALAALGSMAEQNADAVAITGGTATFATLALTSGALLPGTHVPTLTNVTNVSASSAYAGWYVRLGDIVVWGGRANIDPTSAVASELGISLPVASDFTNVTDCAGVAACGGVQQSGVISADTANNRVQLTFIASDTAVRAWYFICIYKIR